LANFCGCPRDPKEKPARKFAHLREHITAKSGARILFA